MVFSPRKQSPGLRYLSGPIQLYQEPLRTKFSSTSEGSRIGENLGWPDLIMEPDDFDSEDKEILSWDINDVKLPQVRTCYKNLPSTLGYEVLTINMRRPGRQLVRVRWVNSSPPELQLDS